MKLRLVVGRNKPGECQPFDVLPNFNLEEARKVEDK